MEHPVFLFSGLTAEEKMQALHCLAPVAKVYDAGEWIVLAGETMARFGWIESGAVLIIRQEADGGELLLSQLEAGDLFGESFAFGNLPFRVSVCAKEHTVIRYFECSRFLAPCEKSCLFHQKMVANLLVHFAQKNVFLTGRIEHLSRRTLREKILSYLSAYADKEKKTLFSIPFDRQQLADYLGCDRSALSAALSKLRTEGVIDYHKNTFRLIQSARTLHAKRTNHDSCD